LRKITLLLMACGLIFSIAAYALEEDISSGGEIKLYMGEMKVISANMPTRVVIGNPSIVDVTAVSETSVTLTPKNAGATTFVMRDNFGEQSCRIRVLAEDMSDVQSRIDNLIKALGMPGVYTQAVDTEGKVLLLGQVKTAEDKERIATALGALKDKTTDLIQVKEEETVVDINVEVLELNRDGTSTLGFTWPGNFSLSEAGYTHSALSAIFNVTEYTREGLEAQLDLLVREGKARVLSRPNVACQSGKEAELLVGGEKPIFTTTVSAEGGATSSTVEYKEYGIKLNIKPVVMPGDRIHLKLLVEVSEVGDAEILGPTAAPTAKAFPLTKRNTTTELYLNNNQTLAIGGLIKQKTEEDLRKVPVAGDIPLLGGFFRKRETMEGGGAGERGDVELFITLTPRIIASGPQAAKTTAQVKKPLTIASNTIVSTIPAVPVSPSMEELDLIEAAPTPGVSEYLADYINTVYKKIIDAAYYPADAKQAGWQGTVKLVLNISFDGTLKDVKLKRSSGYKILDDAAVETVCRQSPYPALPAELQQDELRVEIPVAYRNN